MPNINMNLTSVKSFFRYKVINEANKKIVNEEIDLINEYFELLTKNIDLEKVGTIKEQNIIFFLFYFMNNSFFYIMFNPNFSIDKTMLENNIKYFNNLYKIKVAAELYLNKDKIKESNILINNYNELIDEYYELVNYKEEFKDIVEKCNYLITIIVNFIKNKNNEENEENEEEFDIREKMMFLLEKFVLVFNIYRTVNEKYNIIDYKCFYNDCLSKHLNLVNQFKIFLRNERILNEKKNMIEQEEKNDNLEFTLFNYTWLFGQSAKYEIINLFNENKQIQIINNNFNNISESQQFIYLGEIIDSKDTFFKLNIRRDYIIEDTLNEISNKSDKLQNPLKVEFIGEEAEDEGGVRKEFFMLVTRKLFDVNYGMFIYNEKSRLFWFNINSFEAKIKYELIGTILGLALFNGIILDIKFPLVIYKKLLGISPCLNDLKEYDPELYNSLNFLVNTDNKNLKEELDTNFTVSVDKFGEKIIIPLKPNGENIMIDYENKNEYVEVYVNWFFNESIKAFYNSFEKGFYKVFD